MIPLLNRAGGYPTVTALVLTLSLSACFGTNREDGADPTGHVWVLQSLHGAPFPAQASLSFPNQGRIEGTAPCNRYSATMETKLPAFVVGPILSTRRACPDLALETAYFKALKAVERAEGNATTLTLMGPDGRDMVFTAAD